MNDALFDNIKRYISERLDKIEGRIEDIVPRRKFSKRCTLQWLHVVRKFYDCSCPCCRKIQILDPNSSSLSDNVHLDHFNGRERNGVEDGWPVCKQCNQRLNNPEFKDSRRPHFTVFQDSGKRLRQFAIGDGVGGCQRQSQTSDRRCYSSNRARKRTFPDGHLC
jgi:hypothetical protein